MAVTIRDIAERLNVSKSTVSYALSGGSTKVSPEVRAKVVAVAAELGFHPNQTAQSLARRRTRMIGFVPHDMHGDVFNSPFVQSALHSIFAAAHQHEMHVLLPAGYDPLRSEETQAHLFSAPVDGIILLLSDDIRLLKDLRARKVPLMGIAGGGEGFTACISADNYGGATEAFEYLYGLGHRKIGVLSHSGSIDTRIRLQAYTDSMNRYRLPIRSEWMAESGFMIQGGFDRGMEMLSLSDRPTAVMCVNDHAACGLMRAAYTLGIRIPQELSVIGFDDDPLGQSSIFPLTTVRQPVSEMAKMAFYGVLDQLDNKEVLSKVLPTTLILRATTQHPMKECNS